MCVICVGDSNTLEVFVALDVPLASYEQANSSGHSGRSTKGDFCRRGLLILSFSKKIQVFVVRVLTVVLVRIITVVVVVRVLTVVLVRIITVVVVVCVLTAVAGKFSL